MWRREKSPSDIMRSHEPDRRHLERQRHPRPRRRSSSNGWSATGRTSSACRRSRPPPRSSPRTLCNLDGYWCYWHGAGGVLGGEPAPAPRDVPRRSRASTHPAVRPRDAHRHRHGRRPGVRLDLRPQRRQGLRGQDRLPARPRALGRRAARGSAGGSSSAATNVARSDQDVHPKERKPNVIGQRPEERELLARILAHGLVDVGRALDPDNDGLFTWWAPWRNMRQRNIGWRIDYILASESLKPVSSKVLADVGTSDHAPVVATFEV